MFTGIIEELGIAKALSRKGTSCVLSVKAKRAPSDANTGDSVSVNGVCLTVIENAAGILKFDISDETLKKTNIGELKPSDKVNLERSLKIGSRLGGHFVTGHIDCVAEIKQKEKTGDTVKINFSLCADFSKYIVSKGSVAIDGISLTVGEIFRDYFSVYIIPHTLAHTTLAFKKERGAVNVEFDILAKYVAKVLPGKEKSNLSMDFLSEHGFTV